MLTVNLRYTGKDGAARRFAEEMTSSGTVAAIRAEAGNLRYEYYLSMEDEPDDGDDCAPARKVRSSHDGGALHRDRG